MNPRRAFQDLAQNDELAVLLVTRCYQTIRRCVTTAPWASEVGFTSDSPEMIQQSQRVVLEAADDPSLFNPNYVVTTEADTSGDPQISYDRICHEEAHQLASAYGVALYGEEDQYRSMGAEGPALRGEDIRLSLREKSSVGVLDAVDGTHQLAGMNQPGAFGSAVLTIDAQGRASTAIALGTGSVVSSNGVSVWQRNLADPLDHEARELSGAEISARAHYALTWVMSASKPGRLSDAARVAQWARANHDTVAPPTLIAPLGGNPGIISSMVLAPGGAVAAYQPKSWAWDQLAAHICATLGFTVLGVISNNRYSPQDLIKLFLRDLGAGNKTEALVIGKTFLHAQAMRMALIGGLPERE